MEHMDIIQVATGLISIPPNGWGAVERIIAMYQDRLTRLGMNVSVLYPNQIEKKDNQLVHCHMANTAIEMRDRGIPYVYSLHDHHAEYYGKDSGVYHNNLAAIKGSVFSICHSKHIIDYFDSTDKLFYLPHGVDTRFFRPAPLEQRTEKKLLMICNNGLAGDSTIDRKGFRIAIAAAKWFKLPITIAGPQNNEEFFKGHPDLLEYEKLTLKLTNPTDDETLKLYQTHSIFVAPSFLEYGHPNLSILEAASCCLPIVGTCNEDVPGMYRIPEISTQAVVIGLTSTINKYSMHVRDQYSSKHTLDWFNICKQLKKFYDAVSIINQKWTSEDTTNAYLNAYYGF
jgi:glycosyltransferase involved in cell wall biosynthesis